eukprot:73336_1
MTVEDTSLHCVEHFYEQPLDHFDSHRLSSIKTPHDIQSYHQRYFVCGTMIHCTSCPIFFYFGNEANVKLYIKNTGLMWENYEAFNATMIFAEHRYWGRSIPFTKKQLKAHHHRLFRFLTPNQALADYARLIQHLNPQHMEALIGFGGSYGGMLCSWFSMKYPSLITGCIASSAPILDSNSFYKSYDIQPNYFSRLATKNLIQIDAHNKLCVHNIRKAYQYLFKCSKTAKGRSYLSAIFGFCDVLQNETIANATAYWTQEAILTMSMGSYPFTSSYMTPNGSAPLPPYPLNYGCDMYMNHIPKDEHDIRRVLHGLSEINNMYHNASQSKRCYDIDQALKNNIFGVLDPNSAWNWIECSSFYSTYSTATDGVEDMFWHEPWTKRMYYKECTQYLGIKPNYNWMYDEFGAYIDDLDSFKNVIFSYGLGDPWNGACPRFNNTKTGIYSISYGFGGHHQDLMWSNDNEMESVNEARLFELQHIEMWINEHYDEQSQYIMLQSYLWIFGVLLSSLTVFLCGVIYTFCVRQQHMIRYICAKDFTGVYMLLCVLAVVLFLLFTMQFLWMEELRFLLVFLR